MSRHLREECAPTQAFFRSAEVHRQRGHWVLEFTCPVCGRRQEFNVSDLLSPSGKPRRVTCSGAANLKARVPKPPKPLPRRTPRSYDGRRVKP